MHEVSRLKDQFTVDFLVVDIWLGFFLSIDLFFDRERSVLDRNFDVRVEEALDWHSYMSVASWMLDDAFLFKAHHRSTIVINDSYRSPSIRSNDT